MVDNTTSHLTNINDDSNIVLKRYYKISNLFARNLVLKKKKYYIERTKIYQQMLSIVRHNQQTLRYLQDLGIIVDVETVESSTHNIATMDLLSNVIKIISNYYQKNNGILWLRF